MCTSNQLKTREIETRVAEERLPKRLNYTSPHPLSVQIVNLAKTQVGPLTCWFLTRWKLSVCTTNSLYRECNWHARYHLNGRKAFACVHYKGEGKKGVNSLETCATWRSANCELIMSPREIQYTTAALPSSGEYSVLGGARPKDTTLAITRASLRTHLLFFFCSPR